MRCPTCSSKDTRVIDTRVGKNGLTIRRRRLCDACGYRFNTREEVLREGLVVVKRDDRREPFDRRKMLNGILRACEKRPVDVEQVDILVSDVTTELERKHQAQIPSSAIGDLIMEKLRGIDKVAYVRYASVYKDFRDVSEFKNEISQLEQSR